MTDAKKQEHLILGKKVESARESRGLKRMQLARKIDCGYSTVYSYETAIRPISADVLLRIKRALGIPDVPLTAEEVAKHKKVIYSQNSSIDYRDTDHVNEVIRKLMHCSEWCYDLDLKNLCDTLCAIYTFAINDIETHDKLMKSLRKRKKTFTEEHSHWYYRCLGFVEHSVWRYKTALSFYLKAETHGNRLGSDYQLNYKNLYYNMGFCSVEMGYSYRTIKYFEKVQLKDFKLLRIDIEASTKRFLAISYSMLGETDEALEMLQDCLGYTLQEKPRDKLAIGGVYLDIGRVYQEAGDFDKALENMDKAFSYCNESNESLLVCLCYKATLLRSNNFNDKVMECLDKGFRLAIKGTLWYEWLMAIKYSISLDDNASINTLEWTSIPALREYGKHSLVMNCYEWISEHCKSKRLYRKSSEYSNHANQIYKRLMKGDLSL